VKVVARTGEIELVRDDVPARARNFALHDIEMGLGSVWLQRLPVALKVDPEDGSHSPIRGLEGEPPSAIAVGAEVLWVAGRLLFEVDPATGRVRDEAIGYLPGDLLFPAADVVEAFGRVWLVSSDGSVVVVEPATGDAEAFEIGDTPERLVAGTDAVWVLDDTAGTVWRLDPSTAEVVDRVALSGSHDEATSGGGFVWVLDTGVGILTPISEGDGGVRPGIDVGADASDVAFGLGSVWVASGGEVLEIDPTTARVVRTIEIGGAPVEGIAVDEEEGALWLSMAPVD
jgi:streptogramin lyase